ncbi:serine hydrolase [Paremcibacter congregatus]|uniref:Serine hydrolase n=1 Tax=Paremcibacter congregatus TaxID=2043170 RepID=A0A2G4YR52_9PROT|nr:serine hydrolase [Paremcibacter congregatus]PHZ84750.1 serine hydrolase [Paremcibacter congregatus]QDE28942.1 serine hydrolase [Paremcibacter congregatus]
MFTGVQVYAGSPSQSQENSGLTTTEIDRLVERTMEIFQVPGMAVGIIKDGKVIHAKGYGVREVGKKGKVDEETLFSIASTGKSFTAAALALLVDEGRIKWDDKVIDYIPAFQMHDPWVTREFTVKDLLIHNSGLGLGAGDLMFWPTSSFSRDEIIRNLRHLKPVSSFRTEYAYDNLLYIVAGEVIAAVSGMSYEDFVDRRILKPLGMKHCAANRSRLKGHRNIAEPHVLLDGKLQTTFRLEEVYEHSITAAAGGIQCSIKSILKWHHMHLEKGKLPGGEVFLSKAEQARILTPQTITPVSTNKQGWFGTNFSAYGLGWFLEDMYGVKVAKHSGGLQGMTSLNVMVPDLDLGVVVYTNQQAGYDKHAIVYSILEAYLADTKLDWVSKLHEQQKIRVVDAAKTVPDLEAAPYTPDGDLGRYAGVYKDPWFGDVDIRETGEGLTFTSVRSVRLKGSMAPYKPGIFIVRWEDRSLNADAYVRFTTGYDGNPEGFTMKAISKLTDFSFDFHDLDFKRLQPTANNLKKLEKY